MIELRGVTKTFGPVRAVDDLSFTARPGRVTGFLGPNGAGKTTSLRILLGLVRADAGAATVDGIPYAELAEPVRTVGAVLEAASSFHPGRTARDHLLVLCDATGLPGARADEVLAMLGLSDARDTRVGGFSLGMRQRLGLAAALLGDPAVLVLDEPANGLDPAGIRWLRQMMRHLAAEGRTILVSSHVLTEVAQTVDDVVIIARGRFVRAAALHELMAERLSAVRVRAGDHPAVRRALASEGLDCADTDGAITVAGAPAERIGELCFRAGIPLHELSPVEESLEDVFLRLVGT